MSSASLAYYPARSTPKKIPRPRRLQQHRRRTALLGTSAATAIEIWSRSKQGWVNKELTPHLGTRRVETIDGA
jgi:hypothetical protein